MAVGDRHVFVATHSPVLLSQFEASEIFACERVDGATRIRRASEIAEVQDLLADYAAGSLYMSETLAPQSRQVREAPRP